LIEEVEEKEDGGRWETYCKTENFVWEKAIA
jgi:hypothetical protein